MAYCLVINIFDMFDFGLLIFPLPIFMCRELKHVLKGILDSVFDILRSDIINWIVSW